MQRRRFLFLQGLAGLNIVGFDVVEVAPAYDHAEITALLEEMGIFSTASAAAIEITPIAIIRGQWFAMRITPCPVRLSSPDKKA